jgi:hypothetical protein
LNPPEAEEFRMSNVKCRIYKVKGKIMGPLFLAKEATLGDLRCARLDEASSRGGLRRGKYLYLTSSFI